MAPALGGASWPGEMPSAVREPQAFRHIDEVALCWLHREKAGVETNFLPVRDRSEESAEVQGPHSRPHCWDRAGSPVVPLLQPWNRNPVQWGETDRSHRWRQPE